MAIYDVFNGDADGICALQQLRLANPCDSTLITGVKRDIALLGRVEAQDGDSVTVLDISLDKNRPALLNLLERGTRIRYFDHHYAGEIPQHTNLETHIDTAPDTCTSLLVNKALNDKYLPWAVTAAFGDNLYDSARKAAKPLQLSTDKLDALKDLGTYINYNGYGSKLEDLYFKPDQLYKLIQPYEDPLLFIEEAEAFKTLQEGYKQDMALATALKPETEQDTFAVYILPQASWANRVSGVYANQLAQQHPERAHAILTEQTDETYVVSIRAALNNKTGADEVCRQFETGGGRKAAAGINRLPPSDYDRLIATMQNIFK